MRIRSPQLFAPGRGVALPAAVFGGAAALINLLGAYLADGSSFVITVGCTLVLLGLAGADAVRCGIPVDRTLRMRGPLLLTSLCFAWFWLCYFAVSAASPPLSGMMRSLPPMAFLWILVPVGLLVAYRRRIDTWALYRMMVALAGVYVIALNARFALGLGYYHSGRWHAGESLEAIRSGRYAAVALWLLATTWVVPRAACPGWLRWAALAAMPLALFALIFCNARGPWLALALTAAACGFEFARRGASRLLADARLAAVAGLAVVATAVLMWLKLGDVASDFGRLFTLTDDGGSAEGRTILIGQWLYLLTEDRGAWLVGAGYSHGLFYPHNLVVEALVAGGALMLVPFVVWVATVTWVGYRSGGRWSSPVMPFFGLFVLGLIGAQISGAIGNEMMLWIAGTLVLIADEADRDDAMGAAG